MSADGEIFRITYPGSGKFDGPRDVSDMTLSLDDGIYELAVYGGDPDDPGEFTTVVSLTRDQLAEVTAALQAELDRMVA